MLPTFNSTNASFKFVKKEHKKGKYAIIRNMQASVSTEYRNFLLTSEALYF